MPTIRQLPPNLVNQIAAGEVIERPASVVKELLENSIDAGARRIEVTILGGGSELIRVSDDGCGMTADQLPLAIASHATSKLPSDDSLFHVSTLGFRGEAIASIGSVSQLTIRSRARDDGNRADGSRDDHGGQERATGAEIVVRGGAIESPVPCGCPVGTVIEVRNLFFNTPVRRKFLRAAQTENGHIIEAFTRLALANPAIHMLLRNGDRVLHDLPPTDLWSQRIVAFFGNEIGSSLIRIDSEDAEIEVNGFVCDPSVSRGNNRMQYLFLNGRHIRDRSLQHALGEAYRGLLMVGRHPVCFLQLSMRPEWVDVNVHPTKLEVRFTDSGKVYARLLQTLRHHFLSTDMKWRVGPPSAVPSDDSATSKSLWTPGTSDGSIDSTSPGDALHRQSVIDWARGESSSQGPPTAGGLRSRPSVSMALPGGTTPFRPFPQERPYPQERPVSQDSPLAPTPGVPAKDDVASHSHLGFQIHNRYLVTQDEAGMVVIDQHALHERVMYERIREKVLGGDGRLETQRLLVPEPVSLTPAERTAALDASELLARVGIEIDDFGGDTILISGYPAMLAKSAPGDVLRQALETLLTAGKEPESRDLLDHLLHSIACKAAIKAGDRLTSEEITALLEQRELYQDTHHCPHGRPTALFFARDELDRMFGRMGARGRSVAAGTTVSAGV